MNQQFSLLDYQNISKSRYVYSKTSVIQIVLLMILAILILKQEILQIYFSQSNLRVLSPISITEDNFQKSILTTQNSPQLSFSLESEANDDLAAFQNNQQISSQKTGTDNDLLDQKRTKNRFGTLCSKTLALLNDWGFTTKTKLLSGTAAHISQPHYGLVAGLVFGLGQSLGFDLKHSLKTIGMLHVASASGYNIGLVLTVISPGLKLAFGAKTRVFWQITGLILYSALIGFLPPIVRALLMASFSLVVREFFHRQISPLVACFWSVLVMLMIDSSYLTNLSFQLSTAATLGIISLLSCKDELSNTHQNLFLGVVSDKRLDIKVKKDLRIDSFKFSFLHQAWKNVHQNLVDSFRVTCAAQLAVLPLLLAHFGELSLISVFANTLLLWLTPPMTIGGAILVIVANGFKNKLLIGIIALFVYILTSIFIEAVALLGKLEGFLWVLDKKWSWQLCLVYWLVLWWVFVKKRFVKL